jgi:hypothetical protein
LIKAPTFQKCEARLGYQPIRPLNLGMPTLWGFTLQHQWINHKIADVLQRVRFMIPLSTSSFGSQTGNELKEITPKVVLPPKVALSIVIEV